MGGRILRKKEAEKELFSWEFGPRLKGSQTIVSATIVEVAGLAVAADADLTQPIPPASPILDGTKVQAWVAGGTAGTLYDLECQATLNDGTILVLCGRLLVEAC